MPTLLGSAGVSWAPVSVRNPVNPNEFHATVSTGALGGAAMGQARVRVWPGARVPGKENSRDATALIGDGGVVLNEPATHPGGLKLSSGRQGLWEVE